MAETEKTPSEIQIKLPNEMSSLLDEIRAKRAAKFEPLSNKSIVMDAIKELHGKVVKHSKKDCNKAT